MSDGINGELSMTPATAEEKQSVIDYFRWQAPDLKVVFVQKVYEEHVLSHRHDVWDVHTDKVRWWVITNPTNLYSQEQFPNMDLAVTFHVGLCLRIPRSVKPKLSELPIEPFAECYRILTETSEALSHADEVADFQSIGVRCREALVSFVAAGQAVIPWTKKEAAPKKADVRGWIDHLCDTALPGSPNEDRRHLFKSLLNDSWKFSNWLAHSKRSNWHDAEAANAVTENAIGLSVSAIVLVLRGVPDSCPACGSKRLFPERGVRMDMPDIEWERPTCQKCGWAGDPVQIVKSPIQKADDRPPPDGECVLATVPLTHVKHPSDAE